MMPPGCLVKPGLVTGPEEIKEVLDRYGIL
jgi:hypothetical protein